MWPFNPSNPLEEGIAALYSRNLPSAKSLLESASRQKDRPAAALSYLALAHRTEGNLTQALDVLDRAKAKYPRCFEAFAAEAVVRLTQKDIPKTITAFHYASELSSFDVEGHFLKLLLFCLLAEMFQSAKEGPDGAVVSFKLTPVSKIAVLIVDGRASEAAKEPPALEGTPSALWSLAHALALYRAGDPKSAARWTDAASVFFNSQSEIAAPLDAFRQAALSR